MFTGLVEEVGTIKSIGLLEQGSQFEISCKTVLEGTLIGDSISTSGVCLTVTELKDDSYGCLAVAETLRKTNLGNLKIGDKVNLERSLTLEKRIGGHLVQGHVDGLGMAVCVEHEGESELWTFSSPPELAKFLVNKGSVTLNGVSLTIVDCNLNHFRIALIPQTLKETTMGELKAGDAINIEVDILGKYVHHFLTGDNEYIPKTVHNIINKN